ncbi:MAG: DEAD/DEAH box helicase [Candidatus Omnitrophica bacterium]|nr:DEAD/DEAH box helicase [Candidatus Omnitrophota bacterium]
MDKKTEKNLIYKLFEMDVKAFASRLGYYSNDSFDLTDIDAVRLLNLAESYSRKNTDDKTRQKCLMICGLLWEHKKSEWQALPIFVTSILIRLGLGPSASMTDKDYDFKLNSFGTLGSFLSELYATRSLLNNEVLVGGKKTILLSEFQKRMWDLITNYSRVGISAPTSAGKSFVLAYKIADCLSSNHGEIIYIVPTLSLISQVSADIKFALEQVQISDCEILQTYSYEFAKKYKNAIYVLTQERAMAAFAQAEEPFDRCKMLVVDEIQNVERVADESEERAHTLLDVVCEFHNSIKIDKIIVSGPRIRNIQDVTKSLFGVESHSLQIETPPVINLNYSFSKKDNKSYLTIRSSLKNEPLKIELNNLELGKWYGKKRYTPELFNFIDHVLGVINKDSSGTLVFAPTSKTASNIAIELTERRNNYKSNAEHQELIISLKKYLEETIHPKYSLLRAIDKGIAYHHGKVPEDVRIVVEHAFKSGLIDTIVCTTTLMQGVNLPAKNIIARNPNLFIQSSVDSMQLTPYEFANLRGRAGRLMKDLVGRAIILDEGSFVDLQYLDGDAEKELTPDYASRFEDSKENLIEVLETGDIPKEEMPFSDLIVYVRQMILRHGDAALNRMKQVGVILSSEQFNSIRESLRNLSVSKEICLRNPYWDPIVLNKLFQEVKKWDELPKSPFDSNFVGTTLSLLKRIEEITPYYFNKYFGIKNAKMKLSVVLNAQNWATEKSLNKILSDRNVQDTDEIDHIINVIAQDVKYSLPKLLRPVVHMQNIDSPILNFIEMGAYKPVTRRLMEMGVPRETALKISERLDEQKMGNILEDESGDGKLISFLQNNFKKMPYWERIQLQSII